MAIRNVSVFQVNAGRRQEFLGELAAGKKILERLGANVRAAEATVGGPNTGNVIVALEFADMAAFAAFTQKAQADSDWQAFQAKVTGGSNPTRTLVSRSLLNDIEV